MACPSNCDPYLAAALCNASNSSFFQYVTTNLAPSSRNARLIARPNPPVPPATNTTLPENLVPISLLEPALSIVVLRRSAAPSPLRSADSADRAKWSLSRAYGRPCCSSPHSRARRASRQFSHHPSFRRDRHS